MNALTDGYTGKFFTGLSAYGIASKVNDINESLGFVYKAINDPTMSPAAKTAKCTAETVFITTRAAEITQKPCEELADYRFKAVLNGVATAADAGRKFVDACIKPQPNSTTLKKIGFCVITGATEAATNLAIASGSVTLAVIGTGVNVTLTLARITGVIKI